MTRAALSPGSAWLGLFVWLYPLAFCHAADSVPGPQAELVGIARLPADVFVPGPVSGQFIDAAEDAELARLLPFSPGQPLQGFSAILDQGDGSFLVLADNGYGSKQNSADFVLSIYRIRPQFRTVDGGSGTIGVESSIRLRDPYKQAPFRLVADQDQLVMQGKAISIDPGIRQPVLLTGADFDPESFQRMADGSFWIGDEFGPWMLHFDRVGRLLQVPVSLPGVTSPDNLLVAGEASLAQRSGGFEGMAYDAERNLLFPMLEKPLQGGGAHVLIHAFDPQSGKFLKQAPMRYPLDQGATSIGAIQYSGRGSFIVLERDNAQGEAARIKRIYRVDEARVDEHGLLQKLLLVDLLDIQDPHGLAGANSGAEGKSFAFSFQTIESLIILGPDTLGLVNDNNYPFGDGPGSEADAAPEDTVFIVLKVAALRQD